MPRYTFGPFSLDTEARVLFRAGEPVPMAAKTFDTLVALVQNRGRLVGKDELLSKLWAGTVVEEANLSQAIFTVRKVLGDSPKDPRYIATVPGRGYQFIAEVRELAVEAPTSIEPDPVIIGSLIKRHKKIPMAAVAAAVAALWVVWFVLRRPAKAPAELVEHRLTFNATINPVASAAISPDGKYIGYSDRAGIHVRLLSTGEEHQLPLPSLVPAGSIIYVDSWFPDGTQLLVHSQQAGGHGSMWVASVMGRSSRKLRDDAVGWDVSPDGKRIAFSPRGTLDHTREIWLIGNQGDNPQKILGLASDESLESVRWSPDGLRLAYIREKLTRKWIETCDLTGTKRTEVVATDLRSICWLPGGRIVYSQGENRGDDSNLWKIGIDARTGTPLGRPRRITRATGHDLRGLSASADGTRLVLQKLSFPGQVYLGELASGEKRMSPPRQLTHDEAFSFATAWTADSKAVLFESNRNDKWGIYKQEIDQETAVPLVEGSERARLARLSPDGAWVLYEEKFLAGGSSSRWRLMRVPVNGGLPELVFVFDQTPYGWDYQCARVPTGSCVVIYLNPPVTATAFDPLKGKGKLLRALDVNAGEIHGSNLSPDGSILAVARGDDPDIHISLLSLSGGSDREIRVKGWQSLAGLDWSPDGKGLYIGSTSSQGGKLLYVDLKGNARVLWQSKEAGAGTFFAGLPSPDGRYLALGGAVRSSNVWMVEGF